MKYLTSKEMSKVDELAMGKFNISIDEMMENAGRNMARFVQHNLRPKKVLVVFGKGNNGGDGLAAARHLLIYGVKVALVSASPINKNNSEVKRQLSILKKSGLKALDKIPKKKYDVIIDSLLGYNIKGNPRKKYAEIINQVNKMETKVVSFDLPSGMDPYTGKMKNPAIKAHYTLTLALPKTGLKKLKNVYLANLGIPNKVYSDLGIKIENYFSDKEVIKI